MRCENLSDRPSGDVLHIFRSKQVHCHRVQSKDPQARHRASKEWVFSDTWMTLECLIFRLQFDNQTLLETLLPLFFRLEKENEAGKTSIEWRDLDSLLSPSILQVLRLQLQDHHGIMVGWRSFMACAPIAKPSTRIFNLTSNDSWGGRMGTDTAVSREAGDREFRLQLQVLVFGYFSVALTTIESFDQNQSEFGRLRQEEAEVEKLSAEASQKTLHFVADGSPGTFAWLSGTSKLLKCPKGVNTRVKCMQVLQHQSRIQQQEEELCSLRKERFLHLYRAAW